MKLLNTFSKKEILIEDDEAENIKKSILQGRGFIELRLGDFINISSIESITEIPVIAFSQGGYQMSKDGRSFMRDGQRVYVDDLSTIQYLPDPKYKEQFKQLK